jgi:competence protein ComEC
MSVVTMGVGWFLGLWLASLWEIPTAVWLSLSGAGLLAAGLARRQPQWRWLCLGLLAVGLGGARYQTAVVPINEAHVAYYNGRHNVALTGVVVDEPDVRDRYVNLRLAAEQITFPDGTTQPVTGLVLVRTFRFPVTEYGARLVVNGRLETPPEGVEFSYKEYLARQGIHSLMALPRVRVLDENAGSPVYHAIFTLKARAQATINRLVPEPQASLLSGILLGNDNGIPPELAEAFRRTGVTHIIAISGFNIAILIAVLMGLTDSFLPPRAAVLFAFAGVALYTVLVGADASVVRAAIMGSIYLGATRWLGRPNFAYASLFVAGFLMTLVRPLILWDVGFQLSFAATLGLMLYADPFTQWTRRRLLQVMDTGLVNRIMGVLSEAVLLTVAAQVLTLPLMIAYFGHLSLASLPANALILPAQPGVMIWGGLATVVGMIAPALGQVLAWVAWLFLSYTIALARLFATLPGAAVPIHISPAGVVGIYGVIAAVTWLSRLEPEPRARVWLSFRRNLTQRLAFSASLVAALLTVSWGASQPDGHLHIVCMNVGQGDATFIQTPSGRQILVDGGFYPSVLNDQLGRRIPFWDKEIDILVATHPDADHVSGLVGVFDRYRVGRLITDGEGLGESPIYDAVLLAAEAAGTPIHPARAGEVIQIEDGVRLEVLHPGPQLDQEQRNENSVSMRLVYGDFTFLFTGDAEQRGEQAMLASGRSLSALVFKAGHHGSNSSSSAPFLQAVRPQIVIVSAGAGNRFGHPAPEMLQRARDVGAAVLRTDELGTIEVITDGQTMWWQAGP